MKKFKFRLQKVLEYRTLEEEWAKETYLAARIQVLVTEAELSHVLEDRVVLLDEPADTLEARQELQLRLEKSDEDERSIRASLAVLRDEEAGAMDVWTAKRQDLKALTTLRDEELAEWQREAGRREQGDLDDWSSMRRAS